MQESSSGLELPTISDEVMRLLHARHEVRVQQLPEALNPDDYDASALGIELTRELIGVERKTIHAMLRDGQITDETRRRIRDKKLRHKMVCENALKALEQWLSNVSADSVAPSAKI